jgi:hypothetical protein
MAIFIGGILILAIAIIVVVLIGLSQPKTFEVNRSTTISAPAARIFPLIDNFHQWTKWSPWENIDTDLTRTYSGADRGPGAAYGWDGKKSGAGHMLITDSREPDLIIIKLDFTRPMVAHNTTEFSLAEKDGMTQVAWRMYGPMPFMHRVMSTFFSMDKMVGGQFAQGLAKLKAVAEA